MTNKIVGIYGKIVKILNIIFCILFFIPANVITGFYLLVAVRKDLHFCFDQNSFFNRGADLFPGMGDAIFFVFGFPTIMIFLYLMYIVLPANFLYLPIYFKQIKNGEFFLQKINLTNIFIKESIWKKLLTSFIILEIFCYCFTFLFLLFYFIYALIN